MIARILVPYDFSECAHNAAEYAAAFAAGSNATIDLLHCLQIVVTDPIVPAYFIPDLDSSSSKALKSKLDQVAKQLSVQYKVKVNTSLESGFVLSRIIEFVSKYQSDLVIMGTETEKDWLEKWMGSFSAELAQGLKVPVMVVPSSSSFKSFKHVLYATDFTGDEELLTDWMNENLLPNTSEIAFIHFTNDQESTSFSGKEKLKQWVSNHLNMTYEEIKENHPIEALDFLSESRETELLVLQHKKRSALSSLFHQSFSKAMVKKTHIPILVFN